MIILVDPQFYQDAHVFSAMNFAVRVDTISLHFPVNKDETKFGGRTQKLLPTEINLASLFQRR